MSEEEFEVERILDVATLEHKGNLIDFYAVQWKDQSLQEVTCEPIEHLSHCQEKLIEFYEYQKFIEEFQKSAHLTLFGYLIYLVIMLSV